ncbi:hypothetical protein [Aliarcobacter lanthieri]|uniref:hypothetical protein n=1 Tax=Aliarcobacter lanthieri TaxID=1355374 RepID=UPI00047AC695|nr:hypothetical protein [Aliarcobacter lanthieri]
MRKIEAGNIFGSKETKQQDLSVKKKDIEELDIYDLDEQRELATIKVLRSLNYLVWSGTIFLFFSFITQAIVYFNK